MLLGNHLIGWYLAATSITSVYGAAGSIVIVLLWVYYSSQVVLFGAEFTRVYAKHRGVTSGTERKRDARHPKDVMPDGFRNSVSNNHVHLPSAIPRRIIHCG